MNHMQTLCGVSPKYHEECLIKPSVNNQISQKSQGCSLPKKVKYLEENNYLSEFDTKEKRAIARKNLGVEGYAQWGNIEGYIENQQDLLNLINDNSAIRIVDSQKDLIKLSESLKDGSLAYVKDSDLYFQFKNNEWKEASFNSSGIPILTEGMYDKLNHKPNDYIMIDQLENKTISNNTYTTSVNGTYIDILFQAIRSLQSEVSKLKNSFYYGIQSYTGTDTASASIITTEEQEAKEPLWAIDPEDLSEFEDYSILIGPDNNLEPITNLSIENNYLQIFEQVNGNIDLNFEISNAAKQCIYIIADIKDNSSIDINLSGESELTLSLSRYLPRNKCNILLIINRKVYNEDQEQYYGKNYIWIQVTDSLGNVVKTGYIYDNEIHTSEHVHDYRYYVNSINFSNINLYKCNFYEKSSGFTNDDILSSITPNDNFTYKAAHITIRSVVNKDTLLQIKNRLLENELIFVESESQIYIKSKNQLISIGSKTTTNGETMTSEEILNILAEAGYITSEKELDSAKLNDIEKLTFIHSESNQKFNMKINSDGKLIINQDENISPDTWEENNYTKRGAVGHYTIGANFETTNSTQIYGQSTDPKAYGDRVRFGSWYVPVANQSNFGCSHDFIELANSGSNDYPLEGARLFIIKGKIIKEDIDGTISNYLTNITVHKFYLSGQIKAGSTYLIRGEKHYGKSFVINVDSYDYELWNDNTLFSLKDTMGMVLLNASNSEDIVFDKSNNKIGDEYIYYLSKAIRNNDDPGSFDTEVRSDLIDCIGFNDAEAFRVASSDKQGITKAFGNAVYTLYDNHITKDFFELDPSRQGFLSLTTKKYESTNYRLDKINAEYLDLNNRTISFPHSDEEAEIARFTPKASYENKTICTDKTPLSLTKPNMVSCFFGINMQTTRCFNWISIRDQNEYVWIRKQGDSTWNRFESYKGDDSELSDNNDTYVTDNMNRVKYTEQVINSTYKRMKGIFPGSNYAYTSHKCIVYIQNSPNDNPVTYEYLVGTTLNNGMPDIDKCSSIQTFTLYPNTWKPMVYQISDQQGFEWTEYQVWAASAKQILKQINEECTETTKTFPVIINTGDCTQNGTRYNEWLDYYNAGYCLFDHLEQLNVVGNNDLANAYDHSVLGTGNDEGKSNPYYFHLINCYELDNTPNYSDNSSWQNPLIYNNIYIPSVYYTYFDNFGYLLVNSELTVDCYKGLFKATEGDRIYNLYTGYLQNSKTNKSDEGTYDTHSLKETLSLMLSNLSDKNIITACHEMPFTVITNDNLLGQKYKLDRSCNGDNSLNHTSLVGSHLNRLHYSTDWDNDDNYWFSQLLQNNGVKLCIGGHKHSYTCTYPIYENPDEIQELLANTSDFKDYHPSKIFITLVDEDQLSSGTELNVSLGSQHLYSYQPGDAYAFLRINKNSELSNGQLLADKAVTYFMVQATGYKLKSNKELPSANQTFSVIKPNTTIVNGKDTADYSQESPMFATIKFDNNQWGISLYRIINIKKTALTKITEFSSKKFATKPIVTERLIINNDDNKKNNYWYTTSSINNYEFDYTKDDSDRCWELSDDEVKISNGTIKYTNYTLTVQL